EKFDFRFYVVSNEFPNAFAAPGGTVFVTTGTMNLIDDPNELAGILAHEVSHVTQRHAVRSVVANYSAFAALSVLAGGRGNFLKAVSAGSALLMVQGFSQEREAEADEQGWEYLVAAHIDPRGLANSLKKLDAETERLLRAKYKDFDKDLKLPQVLSDHPPTG